MLKYWLSIVNVPEVDQYVEIARFAEELGFNGISIADHLIVPAKVDSKYPYTEDGETWWPDDVPWPDPWITLTAMGMATTRLELTTNIYLAALRDPFTAAKAISTASVYTNGRVRAGISAGWIAEEFALMNVDFKSRGRRLDEMVAVWKKLWTGDTVKHSGEFFEFDDAFMLPTPVTDVPIWVGGASKPALRRAAANDGWLGVPLPVEQHKQMLAAFAQMRAENGKADQHFDYCFGLVEPVTRELFAELSELGANNYMALPWLITPWGRTPWLRDDEDPAELDVKKRVLERFAKEFIH